jgi:hypothetical protein
VKGIVPREIIYRQKVGFPTPWASWWAGIQLQELEHMLLKPRTVKSGLFILDAASGYSPSIMLVIAFTGIASGDFKTGA